MLATFLIATRAAPGWERCLEGVARQTHQPVQLIVVVDRALTPAEQEAFAARHSGAEFVFNEHNLGLTRSLNRGLARAQGAFIFRLDDDDECRNDRVAIQVEAMEETGADLCCSYALEKAGPGARSWLMKTPHDGEALRQALRRRNVICHSTLAIRRAALERLGGYDETFKYAQDYALYLKALRLGMKFAVVPEPLVERTIGKSSITVARRKEQIMFSSAARLLHAAECGDQAGFLLTMARRSLLLLTPNHLRSARRQLRTAGVL